MSKKNKETQEGSLADALESILDELRLLRKAVENLQPIIINPSPTVHPWQDPWKITYNHPPQETWGGPLD